MDKTTVYTKTAKGITQVNQKSASLSKDLMKVLKLIDGKSSFGQIMEKAELDQATLTKAFTALQTGGFARVFQTRKEEDNDPFAGDAGGGGDDFDFTAPGKMPAATQRVVAGAANDISELVRQQEKAEAARKVAAQAQDAARAKAKAEAESRAKLEAEARAKAEAEKNAMEQAQRAKEASERAKAELEAKMREETARKAAAAAAQAASQQKQTAEQKAKEDEEQRKFAEMKARAEKEAKALAEARARAEAEAAALAKARAEAEAAAKKQAAEATNAEAQLKARLKEEIETRIRGEMEDLLRNEIEEKTRDEMRAQILEEAKLAAKAELDERIQAERETLHKAQMEAGQKAEKEANAKAAQEAKLRAEAEARAAAATAAAAKAEEEARRIKAQAEADSRRMREEAEVQSRRMREEAEGRAKEAQEATARLEAERRAKYEAEARAKIDAEEADKRRRELEETLESERKAKQDAEARVRIETKARETVAADTRAAVQAEIEGDMTKRAEIEGKAQAKAYMAAKAKAEQDEDEKFRAEQTRKAKEMAELLRSKVESTSTADPDDSPRSKKQRPRGPRRGLVSTILVSVGGLLVLAVAALHLVPMRGMAVKVEQALGRWLHDDVAIASATFRLWPSPHLRVENVAVGKLLDAKASVGRIYLDLVTVFGDKLSISQLEFDGVAVSADAVKRIPTWGNPEGKSETGSVNSIVLKNVKVEVKPPIDAFNADLSFDRKGEFRSARLAAPTWTLSLKPSEGAVDVDLDLRGFHLPTGVPIVVSGATLKGKWTGSQIVVPEFDANVFDGKATGTLKVSWGSGVRLESEFALARVSSKELVAAFTKAIAVTGRMDGNFQVTAEGDSPETLFRAPRAQGKFRIAEGTISNVDLVAVMQSDAAGQRAGVTKFAELGGDFAGAENRAAYRNLSLQGGVLRGNGSLEIGQGSALSGRATLEIRSQVAQDRGSFVVSGTVSRPIIRRGG